MRRDKKEEQLVTETKKASEQLEMWASAMGLSKEDIKNIKIGAVQDLIEEANEESQAAEYSTIDHSKEIDDMVKELRSGGCGGCGCKSGMSNNVLNNVLPYLLMLGSMHTTSTPPSITIHVHMEK
jgi:hypothetical protein